MICPNCGKKIADDSKFCEFCGQKMDVMQNVQPAVNGAAQYADPGAAQMGNGYAQVPPVQPYDEAQGEQPKSKVSRIVGIAAVAAVVAAVAAIVIIKPSWIPFFNTQKTFDSVVYVTDDSVEYIKNAKKKDVAGLEFVDEGYDDGEVSLGGFDPDGNYFFFFRDIDDDYTGDLCRIRLSDIKEDKSKTKDAILEIDSKVRAGNLNIIDANKVVYMRKDDVYLFDGKEQSELISNVDSYNVVGGKYVLYQKDNKKSGYDIGIIEIAKGAKEKEIDDKVFTRAIWNDFIFYTKGDDNDRELYVAQNDGSTEMIDEDVYSWWQCYDSKSIWYVKEAETKVDPADMISDKYKSDDAKHKEYPDTEDAFRKVKESTALSDWNDHWSYYYDTKADFYEEAEYECDEWDYDYISFYNYDDEETYYVNPYKKEFYWYDDDLYSQLMDAYNEAYSRNQVREKLDSDEYSVTTFDVYRYCNGEKKKVASNALDVYVSGDVARFAELNTEQDVEPVGDISELSDYDSDLYNEIFGYGSDIYDLLVEAYHGSYCYSVAGEDVQSYASEAKDAMGYFDVKGDKLVSYKYEDDSTTYYKYKISGKQLVEAGKLDDDVQMIGWGEKGFYYAADVDDDGEGKVLYWDGSDEDKVAVKDAYVWTLTETPSGMIYTEESGTSDLCYYTKGEKVRIGKDVTSASRATYVSDDLIFYVDEDNDLYVTDVKGEDPRRIAKDANWYMTPADNGKVIGEGNY